MNEANLTPLQHQILDLILKETNESKPLPAIAIANKLSQGLFGSLPPRVAVLRSIHVLRMRRYPICSSAAGFFYAHNPDSLRRFINQLQKKIDPYIQLIEELNRAYPNVGQPESSIKVTTTVAVRTASGVAYQNFEVGEDGKPIIPPDTILV